MCAGGASELEGALLVADVRGLSCSFLKCKAIHACIFYSDRQVFAGHGKGSRFGRQHVRDHVLGGHLYTSHLSRYHQRSCDCWLVSLMFSQLFKAIKLQIKYHPPFAAPLVHIDHRLTSQSQPPTISPHHAFHQPPKQKPTRQRTKLPPKPAQTSTPRPPKPQPPRRWSRLPTLQYRRQPQCTRTQTTRTRTHDP